MRDKCTMDKFDFIRETLYYGLLFVYLFLQCILIPLKDMTVSRSIWILLIMTLVSIVTGTVLTFKKRRSTVSVLTNCLGPLVLYFMIAYWAFYRKELLTALLVIGVLTVAYVTLVLVNYFRARPASVSFGVCLRSCLLSCRTIVTFGLALTLVILCGRVLLGLPAVESGEKAVIPAEDAYPGRLKLVQANLDDILLLEEESWEKMNVSQRLDLLKVLADMETAYHGIDPVRLCADPLAQNILGHYDYRARTVTVNLLYLKEMDARTMAETVFHECYHAYQHDLVDIYLATDPEYRDVRFFDAVSHYAEEFAEYIDVDEDPEGYRTQRCEWDSDEYAYDAIEDYQFFIEIAVELQSDD